MKFGININSANSKREQTFLKECKTAGLNFVKYDISITAPKAEVVASLEAFKKAKMPVYVTIARVVQTPIQSDEIFEKLNKKGSLAKRYKTMLDWMEGYDLLGICMIDNVHRAVKSGNMAKFGMEKEKLVGILNELSAVIRDSGNKAVMSLTSQDILGNSWNEVKFDIYDVYGMVSRRSALTIRKSKVDKPIWMGMAGQLGGYLLKSQMAGGMKRIKDIGDGYLDYAFLFKDNTKEAVFLGKKRNFLINFNKI